MPDETSAPVSGVLYAAAAPARRDWVDATVRLATSSVGLFTAYAVALTLAITESKELGDGLKQMGAPPWVGVALIIGFPLFRAGLLHDPVNH
jgi:hypothetical protein